MSAWEELFNESYLKSLRRPEFSQPFQPDQAYGASMVSRSERQNPAPNRDQANAQYGVWGQAPGVQTEDIRNILKGGQEEGQSTMPPTGSTTSSLSLPPVGVTSPQGNLLSSFAAPLAKMGGSFAMNKLLGMFSDQSSAPSNVVSMGGYQGLSDQMMGRASSVGDAYSGISDAMTRESTQGLESAISGTESSVGAGASSASGSVPIVGPLAGLGMSAATGRLQKKPGEVSGETAGAIGGGVVGSYFGPVGTIVGSAAGREIGGKIGAFGDSGFTMKNIMNLITPPKIQDPMSMIKSLFGGDKSQAPPLNLKVPQIKLPEETDQYDFLQQGLTQNDPTESSWGMFDNLGGWGW